jgi:hypothetical protein
MMFFLQALSEESDTTSATSDSTVSRRSLHLRGPLGDRVAGIFIGVRRGVSKGLVRLLQAAHSGLMADSGVVARRGRMGRA